MFIITAVLLFILFNFYIIQRLYHVNDRIGNSDELQDMSVVIAFKNESSNLPTLLSSLNQLNYPKDKFEVILVDDSSDDDYKSVIENFKGRINIKLVNATDKILPAKKGALEIGIKEVSFENIVITDADCIVPSEWLQYYSYYFSLGYDLIFGVSPFHEENSFTNKLSRFENLRSSILTFFFAKEGLPYSAASRNMGYTKKLFNKVKGFSNTTETYSGDDDLFIREAVKQDAKIASVMNDKFFVYSNTKNSIKEYSAQKGRHTSTSHHYLLKHKIIIALWHTTNTFFLFSLLLIPIDMNFILPFLAKIFTDLILIKSLQSLLHYDFNPYEIIYLQIVYEMMLVISFINSFRFSLRWT